MKDTGLFFFIMRTTRLIVAMFLLFAICQPAVADVEIKGMQHMAPNCKKTVRDLCKNTTVTLEEILVTPSECKVTCTYRLPGEKLVFRNELWVPNRESETVNLPDGMPCAFGAACDGSGKCICKFCIEKVKGMPR
uniref:Putative salp15 n=1 Tax=Ixodes ricinus TaxID=34613 RepID=A0A0K8RAM7_IXORI